MIAYDFQGGLAFPVPEFKAQDGEPLTVPIGGLSKLEWFAGQALVGLLADSRRDIVYKLGVDGTADESYRIAQAMLQRKP